MQKQLNVVSAYTSVITILQLAIVLKQCFPTFGSPEKFLGRLILLENINLFIFYNVSLLHIYIPRGKMVPQMTIVFPNFLNMFPALR